MSDEDTAKLASKLTQSLASKEDLNKLASKEDFKRLEDKVDHILKYAENIDEVVESHGKRLTKLEDHLGLPTPTNN